MAKAKNICVFDCETGSLDAFKSPITQIALRTFKSDTFELVAEFETFIKPYGNLEVTQGAIDATMVTWQDLKVAPDSKEVFKVLVEYFKKVKTSPRVPAILAGHNVAFDIAFLEQFFLFHGSELHKYVDNNNKDILRLCTLRLADQVWFGEEKRTNLTECCKRIGYDLVDAHGAMSDVLATEELLKYFLLKLRGEGEVNVGNKKADTKAGKLRYNKEKPFQF